jgi:hypothetical protein
MHGEYDIIRRMRKHAAVAAPGFVLGLCLGIGKPIRDSALTSDVGFTLVPLAFLAIAAITFPLTEASLRLGARWGYPRLNVWSTLLAAAGFFGFWVLRRLWPDARLVYLAFYVWLTLVSMVLYGDLVAHVKQVFQHQPERGDDYTWTAVLLGAVAGVWLFGRFTPMWREELGPARARDAWMLVMGLLLLPNAAYFALRRRAAPAPDDTPEPEGPPRNVTLASTWTAFSRNPAFRRVALFFLLAGAAPLLLKYVLYWVVTERTSAAGGRIDFFANFHLWLNLFTLLMTAVGSDRLIRRTGLNAALLLQPALLLAGGAVFFLRSDLQVLLAVCVLSDALEQSVLRVGMSRLQFQVEPGRTNFMYPVLRGFMPRLGEGLAAVALLLLGRGPVSPPLLLGAWMSVLACWALVIVRLKPGYNGEKESP